MRTQSSISSPQKPPSVAETHRIPLVISGTLARRATLPKAASWTGLSLTDQPVQPPNPSSRRWQEYTSAKRTLFPDSEHKPAERKHFARETPLTITGLANKARDSEPLHRQQVRQKQKNACSLENALSTPSLLQRYHNLSKPASVKQTVSQTPRHEINSIPGFNLPY